MTAGQLGLVRGIGFAILMAVVVYLGDASHLSGVLSFGVASVVSSLALSLEHYLEGKTGNALFGAVKTRQ